MANNCLGQKIKNEIGKTYIAKLTSEPYINPPS